MNKLKEKLILKDNKYFWQTKDNTQKEVPSIEERKDILNNIRRNETAHGGRDAMYYTIKKKYSGHMLKRIFSILLIYVKHALKINKKPMVENNLLLAKENLKKITLDLLTFTHGEYLVVAIDYFTRYICVKSTRSKDTISITKTVEKIIEELGKPETIVTDAGTEFNSTVLKEMYILKNINHHVTSPDKHQSNGRVERMNRKIWQLIRKEIAENKEINFENIPELIQKINNIYLEQYK